MLLSFRMPAYAHAVARRRCPLLFITAAGMQGGLSLPLTVPRRPKMAVLAPYDCMMLQVPKAVTRHWLVQTTRRQLATLAVIEGESRPRSATTGIVPEGAHTHPAQLSCFATTLRALLLRAGSISSSPHPRDLSHQPQLPSCPHLLPLPPGSLLDPLTLSPWPSARRPLIDDGDDDEEGRPARVPACSPAMCVARRISVHRPLSSSPSPPPSLHQHRPQPTANHFPRPAVCHASTHHSRTRLDVSWRCCLPPTQDPRSLPAATFAPTRIQRLPRQAPLHRPASGAQPPNASEPFPSSASPHSSRFFFLLRAGVC